VRAYLAALCHDLANNLPLHAVQLESPDYMGLVHGHHHERDLTVLTPLEQRLMDFCFCAACTRKAEGKHVDIGRIRAAVRSTLEAAMANAPSRPAGHPQSMAEFADKLPELTAYQAFRKEIENTLLQEIKAAMKPSSAHSSCWEVITTRLPVSWMYIIAASTGRTGSGAGIHRAHQGQHAGTRIPLYGRPPGLKLRRRRTGTDRNRAGDQSRRGRSVMFYNYSESPMRP